MSVKEMTWAYRRQGTRIDENIKIYWFVHIIELFISDLSVFIFEFFLKFSFAHLFNYFWFVHFLNCIFLLGHLLLSFDHCFASNVLQKYHFVNLFLFFIIVDGNGSGFEYIKYWYSLTKNVLHKYKYFSFGRKLTLY